MLASSVKFTQSNYTQSAAPGRGPRDLLLDMVCYKIDRRVRFGEGIFVFADDVCVFVFSSHSFWTSSSLDVPAGVTQEEGHTGFLIHLLSAVRALIFLSRRIQPFTSLVDREVKFCVLTI